MKIDSNLKALIKLLSKELPDLKSHEIVNVKLVKKIDNNEAIVSIKGKLLKAVIKSDILLNRFKAEVLKTEPQLELKMIKEPIQRLDSFLIKKIAVNIKKTDIFKSLLTFDEFELKDMSAESLKRFVNNSGLFFESKMKNDNQREILEDFKFKVLKKNEERELMFKTKDVVTKEANLTKDDKLLDTPTLKNAITKLQVNLLINGEIHIPFKSENFDIKEGEIKIKKKNGGFYVYLKMDFTKLGEIVLALRYHNEKVDGTIFSKPEFKEVLESLEIENVYLNWKPIDEKVREKFDLDKELIAELGHFDLLV